MINTAHLTHTSRNNPIKVNMFCNFLTYLYTGTPLINRCFMQKSVSTHFSDKELLRLGRTWSS